MDKALYVAMTGAQAALRAQTAVAHNLANVSTSGFKSLLHMTEAKPIEGDGLPSRVNTMVDVGGFNAAGGALITTGNPLDFALQGENRWLAVQAGDGQEAYTRAADLKVDANGLLTNQRGQPVLGEDGAPLSVPPYQSLSIGADGTVSIIAQGEQGGTSTNVGRVRIIEADPAQLERGPDGLFRLPEGIEPEIARGNVLLSGVIESSNVNPTEQLVHMITLARQFEMNIKLISSGDQNAQVANTLLRPR
jgi:flagellar basal-body rod protein FlgF